MKRYWCISTSPKNWKICMENNVWGMDARYYVTLEKFLKEGDQAVVYIHGGKFVAVVEFVGNCFYEESDIGWTKGEGKFLFPYRIKFKILYRAEKPPKISYSVIERGNKAEWVKQNLIDDITFIADKGKTWNQYLQVSIIRITKEDFDTLCEIIKRTDERHAH